jgi:DNA replication protein DnaC
VPPAFHHAMLADFGEELEANIRSWLSREREKKENGLILVGPPGGGKTHLTCAIVREVVFCRRKIQWMRAAEFYQEIRDSYRDGKSEKELLQELAGCPLLVFDDVGAGSNSDHERRSTLEILDRRMNARLATIVTSNLSVGEIGRTIDERIASRLSNFHRIDFSGKDRRAGQQR